jgi:hypothetical protein
MKKSFSLIELLLTITILILIGSFFKFKFEDNSLKTLVKRLEVYLKQTRYQSLIDDKYEEDNPKWHKKRWTLKFFNCKSSVGGLYYSIYSDKNMAGHANLDESLNDPLTNKKIYSSNSCKYTDKTSKYVLLTKEFGVEKIDISCNSTSSLGQLSFGIDGKVYTKLSGTKDEYELNTPCIIKFIDKNKKVEKLKIYPKTGYSEVI